MFFLAQPKASSLELKSPTNMTLSERFLMVWKSLRLGFPCVCVWYLCVCRGSKYFKIVSDWLTLVADLYGTILVGGPLWTQFDDVVVLAVVFFAFAFS